MWSYEDARQEIEDRFESGEIDLDEFFDRLMDLEDDWKHDVREQRQEHTADALLDT